MKIEKRIKAHVFPRYSPDINPLDFSCWKAVERKVLADCPKRIETVAEYKQRMRKTGLSLPKAVVAKAVGRTATRVRMVKDAKGGNIPRD